MIAKLRQLVRPLLIAVLIVMIGPLAVASGMMNVIWPGSADKFNAGFGGYLAAIPEAFWAFCGLVMVGHQATRSYEKGRDAAAVEAYARAGPALPDPAEGKEM